MAALSTTGQETSSENTTALGQAESEIPFLHPVPYPTERGFWRGICERTKLKDRKKPNSESEAILDYIVSSRNAKATYSCLSQNKQAKQQQKEGTGKGVCMCVFACMCVCACVQVRARTHV